MIPPSSDHGLGPTGTERLPRRRRSLIAARWLLILDAVAGSTGVAGAARAAPPAQKGPPPSLIVILADDLGYGDLGSYGHPTIRTPALDRMAAEGTRFSDFYVAAPVCTPSRAALLTGRLPVRFGMYGAKQRVLRENSKTGLPPSEITLAEALKDRGYATALVGKWHLGHLPEFHPMRHGFDEFFGLLFSNDMEAGKPALRRGEEILEAPADQATLTLRYTREAVAFIERNRKRPFFLFMSHNAPHTPLFASPRFAGKSLRGRYGDVVEELDAGAGAILQTLRRLRLARNTLVVFLSDNGPWLSQREDGGSAGLLRSGKGSTWEGGMRVPAIAWWPGRVPAGRVTSDVASALDIFPTFLALAGAALPTDRPIDGADLRPLLFGAAAPPPRQPMFFYRDERLQGVRKGPWKMYVETQAPYGAPPQAHAPPLLFNLAVDPSEQFDVAAAHPDVIEDLRAAMRSHQAGWTAPPSLIDAPQAP